MLEDSETRRLSDIVISKFILRHVDETKDPGGATSDELAHAGSIARI